MHSKIRKDRVDRFVFHAFFISLTGWLATVYTDPRLQGYLLISALALLLLYEMVRNWNRLANVLAAFPLTAWMPWLVRKASDRMVRPIEIGTRTSALDFVIGLTVAWMFCPVEAIAIGCFVTAWADPFAREVGLKYGKTTWFWETKKTLVGSFTCFLVGSVIACVTLFLFYGPTARCVIGAVMIGFTAMLAELIPQKEQLNLGRFGKTMSPADNFWLTLSTSLVAGVVITRLV